MSEEQRIEQERVGGCLRVRVYGSLTENSPLFRLDFSREKEVIIDFAEVSYLTSAGISKWFQLKNTIPASCMLSVDQLPPLMVRQLCLIQNFLPPQTRILSVQAPYLAESGDEFRVTFELGTHYFPATPGAALKLNLPEGVMGPDGKVAEPDFLEEHFFRFLKLYPAR